jgi:hypothetical protein
MVIEYDDVVAAMGERCSAGSVTSKSGSRWNGTA